MVVSISATSPAVKTPQVDLGNDTAVCQGQTVTIDGTQPLVTYMWSDSSTNATYTASSQQTVWLEITDTFGCVARDSMEVVYPIADLKGDTTVCQGDTFLLFSNVQPQYATSYTWNTGVTGPSILITQPGQYWVDIIAEAGCISTDTILIQFQAPPAVTISMDTMLCPNESVDISATVPNMRSISWSNGWTDTTQTIAMTGVFVATLTDSVYCVVTDSVAVGYHDEPFVELGPDTIVCDGNSIFLVPTVSSVSSFLWNDGSTDANLEVFDGGTYSVDILDEFNCPASDTVFVGVLESLQPTNTQLLMLV